MAHGGGQRRYPWRGMAGLAIGLAVLVGCGGAPRAPDPEVADGTAAQSRTIESLPSYAATEKVSGTISLWGHGSFKHDFMRKLADAWIAGFREHHPDVRFEYRMYGTASAVGALYTGVGNIAILGEEISPAAVRSFVRAKGYPPTDISIATGSVDVNFFDYAHMVFVHKDNPIDRLSLDQLDAVFGDEHRRGPRNIRRWGELGLTGEWAEKPIQPYGWKTDVDFALFFRERVLQDSHRWNSQIREYVHKKRADGSQYDHGQQILDALAADKFGIAVSNLRYANPQVKALALGWKHGGPYYEATAANLISQDYPLVRIIPAIIDRAPGQPVEPAVREFLRYVLSREGQRALVTHSGYLPLGQDIIDQQQQRLK